MSSIHYVTLYNIHTKLHRNIFLHQTIKKKILKKKLNKILKW